MSSLFHVSFATAPHRRNEMWNWQFFTSNVFICLSRKFWIFPTSSISSKSRRWLLQRAFYSLHRHQSSSCWLETKMKKKKLIFSSFKLPVDVDALLVHFVFISSTFYLAAASHKRSRPCCLLHAVSFALGSYNIWHSLCEQHLYLLLNVNLWQSRSLLSIFNSIHQQIAKKHWMEGSSQQQHEIRIYFIHTRLLLICEWDWSKSERARTRRWKLNNRTALDAA